MKGKKLVLHSGEAGNGTLYPLKPEIGIDSREGRKEKKKNIIILVPIFSDGVPSFPLLQA